MKIILCCAGGMSTSLLLNKMKDASVSKNIDLDIKAIPVSEVREYMDKTDIILLGPQIKYKYDELKPIADENGVKIAVIDMRDYGMMKGEKVLEDALKL